MRKTSIVIICCVLMFTALGIAAILIATGPRAEKKPPQKTAALVEVMPLTSSDETVVLELTGSVIPAEKIALRARVGGEVVSVAADFIEGGTLKEGEEAVKIDPVDYELALAASASALETARFNYKLELGRQDIARREWELLKTDDATEQERELALRIPHLAASKAALAAAEAAVENAELDLERTSVHAPFNATVIERNVNLGSQASVQDTLATLAGTDTYRILVSIPVDRLQWVMIPGSTARIESFSGAERQGRVIKLLADLEEKGRMARLLVEVDDPRCFKPENADKQPLLLGEYVRVNIHGRQLEEVFTLPRQALRNNRSIWVVTDESTLDIRDVDVLWRDEKKILIRNHIRPGEQLIISDLTAPIQGMDIAISDKKE